MTDPRMILPCFGAQLELYDNFILIRRTGWLQRIHHQPDIMIPIRHIESLRLFAGHAWLNGMLIIRVRVGHGQSTHVIFGRQHFRKAQAVYETLDDLTTRTGVLRVIRQHQ